jgi:hypothetical protein
MPTVTVGMDQLSQTCQNVVELWLNYVLATR